MAVAPKKMDPDLVFSALYVTATGNFISKGMTSALSKRWW